MTRMIGLAAFLALLSATSPAVAQTAATASDKLKSSCAGDYFQFCSGMDPSGPEVASCFRRNVRQMSPGCQSALVEARPQPVRRVARRRKR